MTSSPLPPLRIEDLEIEDQPETALILTRRALEERLLWLMRYLAPNEQRAGTDSVLDVLTAENRFDPETVRAIRDVLAASDPVTHGQSVSPSTAAVIVDSAARVSVALDEMICRLQEQLQGMPARARLAYAYLALPSSTRRAIALRSDLLNEGDHALHRKDTARVIFDRARRKGLLPKLWTETARETNDIPDEPPAELE